MTQTPSKHKFPPKLIPSKMYKFVELLLLPEIKIDINVI